MRENKIGKEKKMEKFKTKVLAAVVLAAVASLFTVCKATGAGGNLFTTLFDQTIEVGYGELRLLQPHEKELLTFSKTELTKFESNGIPIALSNGDKILGVLVGRIVETQYTLEVYDTDWEETHPGETPEWPDDEPQIPPPQRYYAAPLAANAPQGSVVTGEPGNSGITWLEASSDIQKLVEAAKKSYAALNAPIEIWVAAGTYTAASGGGTVVDIGAADYLKIYGGFLGDETASIGELPAGRDGWFNSYATLAVGNRYGTVKEASRKTILDAKNSVGAVDGDGHGGAAVDVDGVSSLVFDGFTITGGAKSGLFIKDAPETALFTNLEITGNVTSTHGGGGLLVRGGAARLDKLTITNNKAHGEWGGGVCFRKGGKWPTEPACAALVTNVLISDNETTATGGGGGIGNNESAPRLENVVVAGNRSTRYGGGMYIDGGSAVIANALVVGNTVNTVSDSYYIPAERGGGGIYVHEQGDKSLYLVNTLVAGNKVTGTDSAEWIGGGGITVMYNGHVTLINSTVSGNYVGANYRGGGILVASKEYESDDHGGDKITPSSLELYNSLVLGNTGQDGAQNDMAASDAGSRFSGYTSLVSGWTADMANNENRRRVILVGVHYAVWYEYRWLKDIYDHSIVNGNTAGRAGRAAAYAAVEAFLQGSDADSIFTAAKDAAQVVITAASDPYVYGGDNLKAAIEAALIAPIPVPYSGLDNTGYGTGDSNRQGNLNTFFTTFPALPADANTGADYTAANWDFHLKNPPSGVLNGGNAAHYGLVPGGPVVPVIGNMGAY